MNINQDQMETVGVRVQSLQRAPPLYMIWYRLALHGVVSV